MCFVYRKAQYRLKGNHDRGWVMLTLHDDTFILIDLLIWLTQIDFDWLTLWLYLWLTTLTDSEADLLCLTLWLTCLLCIYNWHIYSIWLGELLTLWLTDWLLGMTLWLTYLLCMTRWLNYLLTLFDFVTNLLTLYDSVTDMFTLDDSVTYWLCHLTCSVWLWTYLVCMTLWLT